MSHSLDQLIAAVFLAVGAAWLAAAIIAGAVHGIASMWEARR